MDHNIFETIAQKAPGLSKGKQQIATYILQNPNEAAFQTAAQIGKSVQISESSVVRFATDLGYKGFPEFQRILQEVVKSRLQGDRASIQAEQNIAPNALQSEINKATELLADPKTLYMIATPEGELLIPYCKYSADRIFHRVISTDCHSQETFYRDLSRITSGDVILCLCTGEISPLVHFALNHSKSIGAKLILLTDTGSHNIRALGDAVIPVPPQSRGALPDISTGASVLYRLFSLLMNRREGDLNDQKKRIEELRNVYYNYESSVL